MYAVSVIRDVWKVAGALPGLCGTWNAFVKSLTFLLHRKIVGKLLIDIQDNIDSSKTIIFLFHGNDWLNALSIIEFSSGHSMEEYETLNSSAERFAKNYSFMLIACLIAYICTPIANISFHLLNGTFTDELLILPLEAMFVISLFFIFINIISKHYWPLDIPTIIRKCQHLFILLSQVRFQFTF